jgi:hypothetical protein
VSNENITLSNFFMILKNISSLFSSSSKEISVEPGAVDSAQTSIISDQSFIKFSILSVNSFSL